MKYYVDSSALLKMYHKERGTERMWNIYRSTASIEISELARLELVSSAARKRRSGSIDARAFESLVDRFASDVGQRIQVFPFSPAVIAGAYEFLVESCGANPLKTLDALQFTFFRQNCKPDTVYVSADQRLVGIVRNHGFPVLNPEAS